jgi:hypothetical protein
LRFPGTCGEASWDRVRVPKAAPVRAPKAEQEAVLALVLVPKAALMLAMLAMLVAA